MAHRRKPLAAALALNSGVLILEMASGVGANSNSLIMDGLHNLSDEIALAFLLVAYSVPTGLSSKFLRSANLFNSFGLLGMSGLLIWQCVEHISRPPPVLGVVPIVAGLLGALGNWGVAGMLRIPSREDPAIRLAYVHNLGDTLVSLIPVAAGALVTATGNPIFDPLLALAIGAVIIGTTAQSIVGQHDELFWPERVLCGHEIDATACPIGVPEREIW
jgi:cobalt-zinc-cadmium efflux system protein